jgi:hypothetical protein
MQATQDSPFRFLTMDLRWLRIAAPNELMGLLPNHSYEAVPIGAWKAG